MAVIAELPGEEFVFGILNLALHAVKNALSIKIRIL